MNKYDQKKIPNHIKINLNKVSGNHLIDSDNLTLSKNLSGIRNILSNQKFSSTNLSPQQKERENIGVFVENNFINGKSDWDHNKKGISIEKELDINRFSQLTNRGNINMKRLEMSKGRNPSKKNILNNTNSNVQNKYLEDYDNGQLSSRKAINQQLNDTNSHSPVIRRINVNNNQQIKQSEIPAKTPPLSVKLPNVFKETKSNSNNKDRVTINNEKRISKVASLTPVKFTNSERFIKETEKQFGNLNFQSNKDKKSTITPEFDRNVFRGKSPIEDLDTGKSETNRISSMSKLNTLIFRPTNSQKKNEDKAIKSPNLSKKDLLEVKIDANLKKQQKTIQIDNLNNINQIRNKIATRESLPHNNINNTNSFNTIFKKKKINDVHRFSSSNNSSSTHFEDKSRQMTETKSKKHLINNFAYKSQAGKNDLKMKKINQDSLVIINNIFNLEDYNIFGVLDGHGVNGHFASAAINKFFSEFFQQDKNYKSYSKNYGIRYSADSLSPNHHNKIKEKSFKELDANLKEESIYEKLKENNYEILKIAFNQAQYELSMTNFDVDYSGSTSVIVLILNDKIICANAGDSRAIIVSESKPIGKINNLLRMTSLKSRSNFSYYEVEYLSKDHKPELENEKKRIINCGGRVDKYCEHGIESGPYRVWLKYENSPGLAMSRSIGDLVATSVGVISDPEIIEHDINDNTRYIVLASDGIWEFLDNSRVMEIVNPFYINNDPEGACNALIKESTEWWEQEDCIVDDMTVILIFFNCNK